MRWRTGRESNVRESIGSSVLKHSALAADSGMTGQPPPRYGTATTRCVLGQQCLGGGPCHASTPPGSGASTGRLELGGRWHLTQGRRWIRRKEAAAREEALKTNLKSKKTDEQARA